MVRTTQGDLILDNGRRQIVQMHQTRYSFLSHQSQMVRGAFQNFDPVMMSFARQR
jgi:predicted transglutaminase-like cysteine proteinase